MTNYISNKKIVVGLTGGICCGKSTVSKTFIAHNIPVIDADIIARQVVEPETIGHVLIIGAFGKEILLSDGKINRAELGKVVFSNPDRMSVLNKIMAPLLAEESEKQINKLLLEHEIVVYDGALICEMGHADKYRPLIVVSCTPEQQLERLMSRGTGHGPLTRERAMAMINTQMPASQKASMADHVILTSGTIEDSIKETKRIIEILQQLTK